MKLNPLKVIPKNNHSSLPQLHQGSHGQIQESFQQKLQENLDSSQVHVYPTTDLKKIKKSILQSSDLSCNIKQTKQYQKSFNISTQTQPDKKKKRKKFIRVKQPIFLYILVLFISLLPPIYFILLITQGNDQNFDAVIYTIVSVVPVVLLANIIYTLGLECKTICKFVFMVDNILLSQLGAMASIVGFFLILSQIIVQQAQIIKGWIQVVGDIICLFSVAGNFRIMIRFCQWTSCQVLLYKFIVMIDCMSYVFIGCYVYIIDYKPTMGFYPDLDERLLNFMLLYIFALVAFYLELVAKITDFDGTSELNPRYHLQESDEQQEELVIQQKNFTQAELRQIQQ